MRLYSSFQIYAYFSVLGTIIIKTKLSDNIVHALQHKLYHNNERRDTDAASGDFTVYFERDFLNTSCCGQFGVSAAAVQT